MADNTDGRIQIWANGSINPVMTIYGNFSYPTSIFVTTNGDIYIDNAQFNGQVDKWISNLNTSVSVMHVNTPCYSLFVDINDTLYCSLYQENKVVKRWLNDNTTTTTTAVGTGAVGSNSRKFNGPSGIFVNTNFDLYVADCGNDRIQLFHSGQVNGTTIAGSASANITIALDCPMSIVLDADKYLFIVDQYNNRIVGSGPNGFRCLVGCSGGLGSASNQLYYPFTLSFDRHGNIFVTDQMNNRTQKFLLSTNSCCKYKN